SFTSYGGGVRKKSTPRLCARRASFSILRAGSCTTARGQASNPACISDSGPGKSTIAPTPKGEMTWAERIGLAISILFLDAAAAGFVLDIMLRHSSLAGGIDRTQRCHRRPADASPLSGLVAAGGIHQ